MTYQLDANGNPIKIIYPSGYYVERVYDTLDRLTDIKLNGSASSAVSFSYDALSRRVTKTYLNSNSVSYGYDIVNNLLSRSMTVSSGTVSWSYTYNKVHQMLSQSVSDLTYQWRPAGISSIGYGSANALNQYPTVGAASYSYDGNGNLTGDGTWTYGYNTENMLTTASKTGTSAAFVYDPFLRQAQKTVGSFKTKYVYSGSHLVEEYNGTTNALLCRYVYAGAEEPVLKIDPAGVVDYIHHDHLGSVIAQANAAGVVANKYLYSPFGESASLTGTTIGYTGQRWDDETGLYHYKARYYRPDINRFLQADPIGYQAGMNLYAYVNNDPMDKTDPDGLEPDFSIRGPLGVFGPGLGYLAAPAGSHTDEIVQHAALGAAFEGAGMIAGIAGKAAAPHVAAGVKVISETPLFQVPYKAATGHMKNVYGRLIEKVGDKMMKADGWTVAGKNISTKAEGVNGQLDRLYQKGGEGILRDYKGGTSVASKGQAAALEAGPGETFARGGNAAKAGLSPGTTLKSGGVTRIESVKMNLYRQ